MTQEDYSKVPPPHLLKKFSEQARVDSQKRGHPGYCKTFAKLCIDWAFQEAAMNDLRDASAEVSGVELNSKSSPNDRQIRSSDLDITIALVQQWTDEIYGGPGAVVGSDDICLAKMAAQYGADQELEACIDWLANARNHTLTWNEATNYSANLRHARRPKPPSLKQQALEILQDLVNGIEGTDSWAVIQSALEQLDD